jgi:hypothetical protein
MAKGKVKDPFKDQDIKSLASSMSQLVSTIHQMNKSISVLNRGNLDVAKSAANIIQDYNDIEETSLGIYDLQTRIKKIHDEQVKGITSSLKKHIDLQDVSKEIGNTITDITAKELRRDQTLQDEKQIHINISNELREQAKLNAELGEFLDKNTAVLDKYLSKTLTAEKNKIAREQAVNTAQQVQILNADILNKFAEDRTQNAIEEWMISQNISKNTSKDIIALKFRQSQLEKTKSTLDATSKINQEIITETNRNLNIINELISKQTIIEKRQRDRIAAAQKENVIHESIELVNEGITKTFGDQADEVGKLGKAIQGALISPLAIVGLLIGNALEEFVKLGEISKAYLETSKLTADQTDHIRHFAHDTAIAMRDQGLEMATVLSAHTALVAQYGSMNLVSDQLVEKTALLHKSFGIATENSAGTIKALQNMSGITADTAANITAIGAKLAEVGGVAPDVIMQDIANSSEAIASSFKGVPQEILRSAIEARRLGLTLDKVANISKSLLDFESSLDSQMTASVLLGREINFDKARSLALDGKALEATEEILNQFGSLAEFNNLNVVQREAAAKAAGMTTAELQKSLKQRELIAGMDSNQKAAYEDINRQLNIGSDLTAEKILQEKENLLTQQKLTAAMSKISDVLANVILPVLEPIFDVFSSILSVVGTILTPITSIAKMLSHIPGIGIVITGMLTTWVIKTKLMKTHLFETKGLIGSLLQPFSKLKEMTGSWVSSLIKGNKATKDMVVEGTTMAKKMTVKEFLFGKPTTPKVDEVPTPEIQPSIKQQLKKDGTPDLRFKQNKVSEIKETIINKTDKVNDVSITDKTKKVSILDRVKNILGITKKKDIILTEQQTASTVKNTIAESSNTVKKVQSKSVTESLNSVKKTEIATNNTLSASQTTVSKSTSFLSTTLGKAVVSTLAFGGAILMVGAGIGMAASGIAKLAESIKGMDPAEMGLLVSILIGMGVGIATLGSVSTLAAPGLLALGASVLMVGAGIGVAAAGMSLLVGSLGELVSTLSDVETSKLFEMSAGLYSIAASLGAISIASITALPALLALKALGISPNEPITSKVTNETVTNTKEQNSNSAYSEESVKMITDKLDELIKAVTKSGEIRLDSKLVGETLAINTVRNYKLGNR